MDFSGSSVGRALASLIERSWVRSPAEESDFFFLLGQNSNKTVSDIYFQQKIFCWSKFLLHEKLFY